MQKSLENKIVYVSVNKCVGCKQCETACAEAHSGLTLAQARLRGHALVPRIRVVKADGHNVPIQCRQCEDAPCAHACPTGAILQEEGVVRIRERQCVGCKVCVMACPFGAVEVRKEGRGGVEGRTNQGIAKKCNLCEHRSSADEHNPCACVEACPTGALKLIELGEYRNKLMQARAREMAKHQNLIGM